MWSLSRHRFTHIESHSYFLLEILVVFCSHCCCSCISLHYLNFFFFYFFGVRRWDCFLQKKPFQPQTFSLKLAGIYTWTGIPSSFPFGTSLLVIFLPLLHPHVWSLLPCTQTSTRYGLLLHWKKKQIPFLCQTVAFKHLFHVRTSWPKLPERACNLCKAILSGSLSLPVDLCAGEIIQ